MADAYAALEEGLKVGLYEAVEDLKTSGHLDVDQIDPDQLVERARQAVHITFASFLRDERVGPSLETRQVCERLRVSRQAVAKAVAGGRLIALPAGKARRFPLWQFRMGEERLEMRPDVAELVQAFRCIYPEITGVQIASWARTPQPELQQMTPAEWLERERPVNSVVVAAKRAAAALAQ